uniref:Uncharacterized protein n=1 Tax=Glossina pallidipes TaxID=7398 RepID=A0A1B0A9L3_GLOPL
MTADRAHPMVTIVLTANYKEKASSESLRSTNLLLLQAFIFNILFAFVIEGKNNRLDRKVNPKHLNCKALHLNPLITLIIINFHFFPILCLTFAAQLPRPLLVLSSFDAHKLFAATQLETEN